MIRSEYRALSENPYHISAGGIVCTATEDEPLFAILYRKNEHGKTYHLPKGTVRFKEPLIEAAIREVEEEAGLQVDPKAYIGATTRAWLHPRKKIHIDKTSHYYLFEAIGDTKRGMDEEHDGLLWVAGEEAKKLLTGMPKDEAKFIDRALERLH